MGYGKLVGFQFLMAGQCRLEQAGVVDANHRHGLFSANGDVNSLGIGPEGANHHRAVHNVWSQNIEGRAVVSADDRVDGALIQS
jgi:hypothetical protein